MTHFVATFPALSASGRVFIIHAERDWIDCSNYLGERFELPGLGELSIDDKPVGYIEKGRYVMYDESGEAVELRSDDRRAV